MRHSAFVPAASRSALIVEDVSVYTHHFFYPLNFRIAQATRNITFFSPEALASSLLSCLRKILF